MAPADMAEKIFGWKEEEVINRKIDELKIFAQNNSFADTLLNPTLENDRVVLDIECLDKSKSSKNLNISSFVLRNDLDDKIGLVCYVKPKLSNNKL